MPRRNRNRTAPAATNENSTPTTSNSDTPPDEAPASEEEEVVDFTADNDDEAPARDFNDLPAHTEAPHPADVVNVVIPDEEPERAPLTDTENDYVAAVRDAHEKETVVAPGFDNETGGVIAPKEDVVTDASILQGVEIVVQSVNREKLPPQYKSGGHPNLARIREVAMHGLAAHMPPNIPGVCIGVKGLPADWFEAKKAS